MMSNASSTEFSLPSFPGFPVVTVKPRQLKADVCFDALLLPPAMQSCLEENSAAFTKALSAAAASVLNYEQPKEGLGFQAATSLYSFAQGLPLAVASQLATTLIDTTESFLAMNTRPAVN